jgi:predicted RNA-binding Zn-ribbon protein involved in translation (DUF1610 family)
MTGTTQLGGMPIERNVLVRRAEFRCPKCGKDADLRRVLEFTS